MESQKSRAPVELLREFFTRPACRRGMEPIKVGTEIRVHLDDGTVATLARENAGPAVRSEAPARPDLTFWVPNTALLALLELQTEDVGEVGVALLKAMADSDPARKIKVAVHIGPLDFVLRGYLSVLPLGGVTVMRFLSSKGLTGVGKIKEALSRLRTKGTH